MGSKGRIRTYDRSRGFGFIRYSYFDAFFHVTDVQSCEDAIRPGVSVEFHVEPDVHGLRARRIRIRGAERLKRPAKPFSNKIRIVNRAVLDRFPRSAPEPLPESVHSAVVEFLEAERSDVRAQIAGQLARHDAFCAAVEDLYAATDGGHAGVACFRLVATLRRVLYERGMTREPWLTTRLNQVVSALGTVFRQVRSSEAQETHGVAEKALAELVRLALVTHHWSVQAIHTPTMIMAGDRRVVEGAPCAPRRADFEAVLSRVISDARMQRKTIVMVRAGDLHKMVAPYSRKETNRMPVCCRVMRKAMRRGDTIVSAPPKGDGPSLTVRYRL